MAYIKNNANEKNLPKGYIQEFSNPVNQVVNANQVVALKLDGQIQDDDLDLLIFVAKMKFVTYKLLEIIAEKKGIPDIKNRINYLIKCGCLNCFCLIEKTDELRDTHKIPKDAMKFYCLHEGGSIIIKHFTDEYIDWSYTNNISTSKAVGKYIASAEIYLNIINSSTLELTYYKGDVPFYVLTKNVTVGCHYCFKPDENSKLYLMIEIYNSLDNEIIISEKIRDLGNLLTTNIWRRYYTGTPKPPMVFFVADTEELALKIAKEIKAATKIPLESCRFSTLDRITGDLSKIGSFFKYDVDKSQLIETNLNIFKN